jgi:hypothetical protein
MESSTIQPPNKGPSFNIILIVIVIGVIIFFVFLNKPSQPTTTMIPTTTMMPTMTRMPITTFNYPLSDTGMWCGEVANEYTCPNAPGRNTEVNGWCMFKNENDTKNYCNSDPTCLGYLSYRPNEYVVTRNPIKHNTNANYYKKTPTISQ